MSWPIGVIQPIPVMTTRFIGLIPHDFSFFCHPVAQNDND
jgi:hypothetical protein